MLQRPRKRNAASIRGAWTTRDLLLARPAWKETIVVATVVAALLSTSIPTYAQCNGNTGVRLYFTPGQEPDDITGLRYKFNVATNQQAGLDLKILFGASRLRGPNMLFTYLLEHNLYSRGLLYADPVCTGWPLLGTLTGNASSLRVAIPDYVGLGRTGAKSFAPARFGFSSMDTSRSSICER